MLQKDGWGGSQQASAPTTSRKSQEEKKRKGARSMEACGEGQNTLLSWMAQFPRLAGLESSLESEGNAEHNRFYRTTKCSSCQWGCE